MRDACRRATSGRRCACLMFWSTFCIAAASWAPAVWAIGPSWQLPAGSVGAVGADRMWLFGRLASLRTFEAPGDIADVAVALLAQVSTARRLQPMPDGLLIAGVDGDVHWLVRLMAASPTRTQGSLSAIDLRAAPSLPAPAWLPAGMTVRLDVAADDGETRVRQQILTHEIPAEGVFGRVCSALQKNGWRPDDIGARTSCRTAPLAWPASSFWKRDGATLALVIDRQPAGASLYALQTESMTGRAIAQRWQYPDGGSR